MTDPSMAQFAEAVCHRAHPDRWHRTPPGKPMEACTSCTSAASTLASMPHPDLDVRMSLDGAGLIAAERRRQVEVRGYTPEHDDEHGFQMLWQAGMAYFDSDATWPWRPETFKRTNIVRDHIKAGALATAALEVAGRAGASALDRSPAKGVRNQCVQFLDDVLAGVGDLSPVANTRHSDLADSD